jgi:G3E family GTPase
MADYATLVPINIVTGFLGSGKTTLLSRLLADPELAETAVLVNEFGEVGLDHRLLRHVAESTLLLDNGCLCCAVRGDLQGALRDLLSGRDRGAIPYFRRVVIETSGLADPVPVAYTVLVEPVLQHHFRLGNIVTCIDAVNGAGQLERYGESVKQAAVADRIVLTKTDLAEPRDVEALRRAVTRLNRSAPIVDAAGEGGGPKGLIIDDLYQAEGRLRDATHWLESADTGTGASGHSHGHDHEGHEHTRGVESFTISFETPLDWTAFGIWLSMLLHRHGEQVLRVKGLLNVEGLATPVLVNGVQHIVHPPSHLAAWPDDDHRSHLIFIVQDLSRNRIEEALMAFNGLANPTPPGKAPTSRAGRWLDSPAGGSAIG